MAKIKFNSWWRIFIAYVDKAVAHRLRKFHLDERSVSNLMDLSEHSQAAGSWGIEGEEGMALLLPTAPLPLKYCELQIKPGTDLLSLNECRFKLRLKSH